ATDNAPAGRKGDELRPEMEDRPLEPPADHSGTVRQAAVDDVGFTGRDQLLPAAVVEFDGPGVHDHELHAVVPMLAREKAMALAPVHLVTPGAQLFVHVTVTPSCDRWLTRLWDRTVPEMLSSARLVRKIFPPVF